MQASYCQNGSKRKHFPHRLLLHCSSAAERIAKIKLERAFFQYRRASQIASQAQNAKLNATGQPLGPQALIYSAAVIATMNTAMTMTDAMTSPITIKTPGLPCSKSARRCLSFCTPKNAI